MSATTGSYGLNADNFTISGNTNITNLKVTGTTSFPTGSIASSAIVGGGGGGGLTLANDTTDTTTYIPFSTSATGSISTAKTNANLTYDASNNILTTNSLTTTTAIANNLTASTIYGVAGFGSPPTLTLLQNSTDVLNVIGNASLNNVSVTGTTTFPVNSIAASAVNGVQNTAAPSTSAWYYMPFLSSSSSSSGQTLYTDSGISYNPYSNHLQTTNISGTLTGNAASASTIALTNDVTDATTYIPFSTSTTGNGSLNTNTNLVFNASTNTLYCPNISGTCSNAATAASCSGNAATATTAAACSGNAATATTATTAAACSGNSLTATSASTAVTCSGNAASASQVSTVSNTSANNFFIPFVQSNNATAGNQALSTNQNFKYNPSTITLTCNNISGTCSNATTAAACSGNAATATTAAACSGNAGSATQVYNNIDNTSATTYNVLFAPNTTTAGNNTVYQTGLSSGTNCLTYNPSTTFLSGCTITNATNASQLKMTGGNTTNGSYYLVAVPNSNSATQSNQLPTTCNVSVNPSTSVLSCANVLINGIYYANTAYPSILTTASLTNLSAPYYEFYSLDTTGNGAVYLPPPSASLVGLKFIFIRAVMLTNGITIGTSSGTANFVTVDTVSTANSVIFAGSKTTMGFVCLQSSSTPTYKWYNYLGTI